MADSTVGMPKDPLSHLMEIATQMHELYLALVAAGFTETQAMQIIVAKVSS